MLKQDEASKGNKLLRLYQLLLLDGRRHYQTELMEYLNCSRQTIIRLIREIEEVIGAQLETELDNHKRWYRIRSISRSRLGLEFEEIRYLSICRDLAAPYLPEQIRQRVDNSIFNFSLLLTDTAYANRAEVQGAQFTFYSKGRIDYSPHFSHLECLVQAIEQHLICLVSYKAAGHAEAKEHKFAPKRIVSMNNALYVLGATATDDFQAMRHLTYLAVHRIVDVKVTKNPVRFDIPDSDLGMFGFPWHEPRTFRIKFKPGRVSDYVRERIWSDQQSLEEQDDGGVILEITTRSELELTSWVRSFGEDAEIISTITVNTPKDTV